MDAPTLDLDYRPESSDSPVDIGHALERSAEHVELEAEAMRQNRPVHAASLEQLGRRLRILAAALDGERRGQLTDDERAQLRPTIAALVHAFVDFLGQ